MVSVESLLGEGETVHEWVEVSMHAIGLRRPQQAEFIASGSRSLDEACRAKAQAGEPAVNLRVRLTSDAGAGLERWFGVVLARKLGRSGGPKAPLLSLDRWPPA